MLAALAFVIGCGQSGSGGPHATVSGTVTQGGSPVDGASVTFHSTVEVDGKKVGPFSAMTDSSGKYLLAMVGKEPGIPPGMYKVTITKMDVKATNLPKEIRDDPGQAEAAGLKINVMPKAYESLATSKLSVTLEAGKNEGKNFDLNAAGK